MNTTFYLRPTGSFLQLCLTVSLLLAACSPRIGKTTGADDGSIEIQILQVNDVYEIAPIENGKTGGMARLAWLNDSLKQQNPNTLHIMAGDFLSPSVYNTITYQGQRIRGKQMVETMNAAGTDMVVFGNHEFDITEDELQQRINESNFEWVSTNTFHHSAKGNLPFAKTTAYSSSPFPETLIKTFTDADGSTAKVGFIGLTLPFNKAAYVHYADALQRAVAAYNKLKDSCDAVVALTHQAEEDDIRLAKALPGLAAIIGGHEHDNRHRKVGTVLISKAHANARSAYLVKIMINTRDHSSTVSDKLLMITDAIKEQAATKAIADKWMGIAEANFASLGFDAKHILMKDGAPLEGRESIVRSSKSNLTMLIIKAMEAAAPQAEAAIVNSGSIRVDDILRPPVSEYDILRTLPFGGGITEVLMNGKLLKQILDAGRKNQGSGGWLQMSEQLVYDKMERVWILNKNIIRNEQLYRIALPDFLLTGGEANMGFLTKSNRDIVKLFSKPAGKTAMNDIRIAIIQYLQNIH